LLPESAGQRTSSDPIVENIRHAGARRSGAHLPRAQVPGSAGVSLGKVFNLTMSHSVYAGYFVCIPPYVADRGIIVFGQCGLNSCRKAVYGSDTSRIHRTDV